MTTKVNDEKERLVKYGDLISLWEVQELLLQTYRTIFIAMQSFLIAPGVFLALEDKNYFIFSFIVALGIYSYLLWINICRARGQAVAFVQLLILDYEDGKTIVEPLKSLKEFQKAQPKTRAYYRDELLDLQDGETRQKMETYLPRSFLTVWVILVIYKIWTIIPGF